MPPRLTAVAPVKLVPVMVMVEPTAPLPTAVIVGSGLNRLAVVKVPPGVVTEIVPVAPPATTAVMVVALTTVNEVAAVPPKLKAVAPVRFVPVMVTVDPPAAAVGVKPVMVGTGL